MDIINPGLIFTSTPEKRDTDFYSKIGVKIIIVNDGTSGVDIYTLHDNYKDTNFCGVPFHYIVMENGTIYSGRQRMYRCDMDQLYANSFKNGIYILCQGEADAVINSYQISSLSTLCTMLLIQDNLFVTDIISTFELEYGYKSTELISMFSQISAGVILQDPYRTVGDSKTYTTFKKIVSSADISTMDIVSKYTKIPTAILISMNPHLSLVSSSSTIYSGSTIFLPDNRVSGYLDGINSVSQISHCYSRMLKLASDFEDTTAS